MFGVYRNETASEIRRCRFVKNNWLLATAFENIIQKLNLGSTCILIGQQVCFHSAMKHKNVRERCDCLQVVRISSF